MACCKFSLSNYVGPQRGLQCGYLIQDVLDLLGRLKAKPVSSQPALAPGQTSTRAKGEIKVES